MKFVLELVETEMLFFKNFYSVEASNGLIFFAIFTCAFHWKRNRRGPHINCFQGSEAVHSQCINTWNIYFKMDENNYGGGGFSHALWLLTDAFSSADNSHTAWQQNVFFSSYDIVFTWMCISGDKDVELHKQLHHSIWKHTAVNKKNKKNLTCKLLWLNVEVWWLCIKNKTVETEHFSDHCLKSLVSLKKKCCCQVLWL